MDRRRFLSFLGAATVGGLGAAAGRLVSGEPSKADEPFPLADAAAPPDGLRAGTQRLVWSVETDEPVLALSFDDGPDPDLTPRILEILRDFGVQATFFTMGSSAADMPELLQDVARDGHEIGNHTWTHPELPEQDPSEAIRQVDWTHKVVESITGRAPRIFRPPRGRLSGPSARHAARLGYDIVLWSVGRGVPGEGTPDGVRNHVLGQIQPGDVVLLHDGVGRERFRDDLDGPGPVRRRRDVELRALPEIVEGALEGGFRITTVSGLLEVAKA